MIINIFAIHDSKAHAFLPPFYFHHTEQAQRTFSDTIHDDTHMFSKHPADYTLFHLGTFDDEGAQIDTITPISLGNGLEFLNTTSNGIQPNVQVSNEQHIQQNSQS
jgi:hypothetical protein